ncbi:hypothetical protein [Streptomyces pactum]|uniref:hypothetical protein n=1 Tax=Streptomyces pactum TaxID=68249 RepID=UPI0036FA2EF7
MGPADADDGVRGGGRAAPGDDRADGGAAEPALAYAALGSVAARWGDLSPALPPEAREELSALLSAFRAAEPRGTEQAELAARATAAVLRALPPDAAERLRRDTGVVSGEPAGAGTRWAPSPSAALSGGYSALDLCLLVVDRNPMVGPRLGPVRRRLLAAPALSAAEVADGGGGARAAGAGGAVRGAPRGLIALTNDAGRTVFPAFQFAAGATPWPVVREVNTVLEAGADPWGAADWWLSPHTWWGVPPAGLPGQGRDAELLAAARSLADPEGW